MILNGKIERQDREDLRSVVERKECVKYLKVC